MNPEVVFEAIGMMDDAFLAECMEATGRKNRRILWRTVLVAALVASLSISAVAAVVAELYGRTGTTRQEYITRWGTERREYYSHMLEVYVAFPELRNAPDTIKQYYAPGYFDRETLRACYVNKENGVQRFFISWDLEEISGEDGNVYYYQWCADSYELNLPVDTLIGLAFADTKHSSQTVTHKGREYFFLSVDPYTDEGTGNVYSNSNYLYWTDGAYIFKLNFPYSMTVENGLEIASSVEKISDVNPWLEQGEKRRTTYTENTWEWMLQEFSSEEPYSSTKSIVGGQTEVLEDADVRILLEVLSLKTDGKFQTRMVYPRVFSQVQPASIEYTTSDRDKQRDGYELVDYTVYWNVPEYGEEEAVWYRQVWRDQLRFDSRIKYEFFIFDMENSEILQTQTVNWGTDSLYEVSIAESKDYVAGSKYYFWGDEWNVFSLRVPYDMREESVREILDSIR